MSNETKRMMASRVRKCRFVRWPRFVYRVGRTWHWTCLSLDDLQKIYIGPIEGYEEVAQ